MTIKIDNIELDGEAILAPMSGVTDPPFRRLVKQKFGAPLVISEMIASKEMLYRVKESSKKASAGEEGQYPMAVQLAGCDPELMAEAARINEADGADIIDINYGCPVKKVTNGQHAGSAMMKDEDHAIKVLEAVVNAVKIPVTVKMRMGWDHMHLNAPSLAKRAEEAGIKMITVHGRTRCQFYNGEADWEFIHKVKDDVNVPVIVNGDILTYDDIDEAMKKSGADGVMIGRGCYGKPWFVANACHYIKTGERLNAPAYADQLEIILEHYDATITHYGVTRGIKIARKHVGWYSAGIHGSAEFRHKVMRSNDVKQVKDLVNEFYGELI